MSAPKYLRVKQSVSEIGRPEAQRKIARGLGLRGLGTEVVVANTPSFRGMVKKIWHLLEVHEVDSK